MTSKVLLNGIYDKRTLSYVKAEGISHFGFDFDPRSFNFIQEYLFLEIYKTQISLNDVVYLKFRNNSDYMINKLIDDIKILNPMLSNIFFVFDEYVGNDNFPFAFLVKFNFKLPSSVTKLSNFKGFQFDFKDFEYYLENDSVAAILTNLYSKFPIVLNEKFYSVLNISWNDNLFASLFDEFEFKCIQLNINSEIEVCYRNVDLNKLKSEINFKKKFIINA